MRIRKCVTFHSFSWTIPLTRCQLETQLLKSADAVTERSDDTQARSARRFKEGGEKKMMFDQMVMSCFTSRESSSERISQQDHYQTAVTERDFARRWRIRRAHSKQKAIMSCFKCIVYLRGRLIPRSGVAAHRANTER